MIVFKWMKVNEKVYNVIKKLLYVRTYRVYDDWMMIVFKWTKVNEGIQCH